jgi:hypothetical protein
MIVDLWIEVMGLAIAAFLLGLLSSWLIWKIGAYID